MTMLNASRKKMSEKYWMTSKASAIADNRLRASLRLMVC